MLHVIKNKASEKIITKYIGDVFSIGMALQMSHFYSKKVLAVKHVPDVMNSVLWIFICQVPKQLKQSVDVQL